MINSIRKINVTMAPWTRADRQRFDASLDVLNDLTGDCYGVVAEGLFSKKALRATAEGVDLVIASAGGHRPPEYAMVGFVEGRLVVPTEKTEDLELLAKATEVRQENLFCLYSFLKRDFGLVRKAEGPIRLESPKAARLAGVEEEFEAARNVDPSAEIWWQKWGGVLCSFSVEKERIGVIQHGIFLGNYELIPPHLIC